ncbi:hypothetical protein ACHAXT_000963 [Thalassiosira profunda]
MDANNEDEGDDNDSVGSDSSSYVQLWNENEQRFLALGYDADEAIELSRVQASLTQETARLNRYAKGSKKPPEEGEEAVDIGVGGGEIPGASPPLLHNDLLLPQWRAFAKALASLPAPANGKGYIRLLFTNLQFGKAVQDLLVEAIKSAPLEGLMLMHNGPGTEGVEFALNMINVLPANTLDACLRDRHLDLEHAALLVQALLDHPPTENVGLNSCGIGEKNELVRAVVPILHHFASVSLANNAIGSYGAALIADIVAGNPDLKELCLDGNILDDDDATRLSVSLKTNTKLIWLGLADNRITFDGKKALCDVVFNKGSMDLMYESNHTCRITGFDDAAADRHPFSVVNAASSLDATLSLANAFTSPEVNRKLKMLNLLPTLGNISDLHHLFGFPLGLAPRIIELLGEGLLMQSEPYGLSGLFLFMRHWSMPLLYTNNCDPSPRRSERIRKKKVDALMKGRC